MTTPKLRFTEFKSLGDWESVKLDDVIKMTLREVDKPNTPYNSLGVRSHFKGTFHKFVEDPSKIAMTKLYQVKSNDIIVSITFAWEHAIAICQNTDENFLVSHRFPTYKAKSNLQVKYFQYVIGSKLFKYKLKLISPGGAGRNRVMNKKDFLKININLPTIAEQTKITNFLTLIDKKIKLLTQQEKNLKSYKKTLSTQLLTQAKRFAGFTEEWQELSFNDLLQTAPISKNTINKTDYLLTGKIPIIDQSKNFISGYSNNKTKIINHSKVIIFGDHTRIFKYVDFNFIPGADGVKVLIPKLETINLFYIYSLLKSEYIPNTGYNRHFKFVKDFILQIPPLAEQKRIAHTLQTLDTRITKTHHQLESTKKFKSHLLKHLLT